MEVVDITMIGYGVLLAMLVFENYKTDRFLDELEEDIDDMIEKHNSMAEGFILMAKEIEDLNKGGTK